MSQIIESNKELAEKLESKRQTIKNTVAENATDDELDMFMHLAKEYNLDPFQGEIYFWKFGSKDPTIMTSRDGYLKIANQHPAFNGMDSGVIYPGDTFKKTTDGVQHELDIDSISKTPKGAYAVVYRSDRKVPTRVVVPFADYNKNNKVWSNYPSAMIQKVAESMALKRAFSVSGLVSKEEMGYEGQQSEQIETPNFEEEQYIEEEREAIQQESEQAEQTDQELSERQQEVMQLLETNGEEQKLVIDFLQQHEANGVDQLDEDQYQQLKNEIKGVEMITSTQRGKIFGMLDDLTNDREYYMQQFGIDSLADDNCTKKQANEFIEYLEGQQELGGNGAFKPNENEELVEDKEELL